MTPLYYTMQNKFRRTDSRHDTLSHFTATERQIVTAMRFHSRVAQCLKIKPRHHSDNEIKLANRIFWESVSTAQALLCSLAEWQAVVPRSLLRALKPPNRF